MRLRKLSALLAALAVGALAGAGCSGDDEISREDPRQGGSLVVALPSPPESMDPALASSPSARRMVWLAYTPVLTYKHVEGIEGSRLAPALSEEMPEVSKGGRVYSFTFREGLRYSDGARLRASDFERAVSRAVRLNPRALALYGDVVGAREHARSDSPSRDIRGISSDDRTGEVRMRLRRPDRLFSYALASTWTAPVPARTPVRDLSSRPPPGIGPYRVARVAESGDVVLVRNARWRLPAVPAGHVEEIASRTIPDRRQRVRAALDGRVDVFEGEPPVRLLPDARSKYEDRYEEHPTQAALYLAMDLRRPPFDDEAVRRAVSYSLDVSLLTRIYDGFMRPSCNVLPPTVPGYRRLDPCPFGERLGDADLVEASRLVERADATGAVVRLSPSGGRRERALNRYLKRTLEKIGLSVRLLPRGRARRAQIRFVTRAPAIPHPALYLGSLGDTVLRVRSSLLAQDEAPVEDVREWADVDREVVGRAYIAPYGVSTVGVLTSERVNTTDCSRFHPVLGMDYGSICLN